MKSSSLEKTTVVKQVPKMLPFREFHKENSGFNKKELEGIDDLFLQKKFKDVFDIIEKLKKEAKTKDSFVCDKLVYLISRLAGEIDFTQKSSVLQDFIINLGFNEVLAHPRLSLMAKSILRNDKLYYRSHIGYLGYINIVEDELDKLIAELILKIGKEDGINYIDLLVRIIVNYSMFLFHYGKYNSVMTHYKELIKLLTNKNVEKYLNFVYIHLFYFLIKLGKYEEKILKDNILLLYKDKEDGLLNDVERDEQLKKKLKPFLYVQYKLLCLEYKIETESEDIKEENLEKLKEYIEINKAILDNDNIIRFELIYGKYYLKKYKRTFKKTVGATKQNLTTTLKGTKICSPDVLNLKNERRESEEREGLKNYAQMHFQECIRILDEEENSLGKIEPIIYLLQIETEPKKQKELFFQGRDIISNNLGANFESSYYGNIFIRLGKEYILKRSYAKLDLKNLSNTEILKILENEYKSYISEKDMKYLYEMLMMKTSDKSYNKKLIEFFTIRFPNVRLILKNLQTEEITLNINFEGKEELLATYFKDALKIEVGKSESLKYRPDHLFQDFFSATMKGKKIMIAGTEYILIFDRGGKKEEKFNDYELTFIYTIIDKYFLYVVLNKKPEPEQNSNPNSRTVYNG